MEFALDFEKPLLDLERKIEELKHLRTGTADLSGAIDKLESRARRLRKKIFADLTPWQVVQLSRHPSRPHTSDYLERIVTDFVELHGDRLYRDDPAIMGGLGTFDHQPVMFVGHQKGRGARDGERRNFGMPRPEGFRKARRLMELAGRFGIPVITLIDTSGAHPGVGAEERGQAAAIASSLEAMAGLPVPIISVVIGEGGSGGALAIGVANTLLMMEFATFSVISPEGGASILWKDGATTRRAAAALKLRASDILEQEIADEVIPEPPGGAHRDHAGAAANLARVVLRHLTRLKGLSPEELIEQRYQKFRAMGSFLEK